MTLLIELLGVLALAVAIRSLAGGAISSASAAVAVAVVAFGIGGLNNLWPETTGLVDAHNANAKLSREAANTQAGAVYSTDNEGFLAFADRVIPRTARVFIECGLHQGKCLQQEWVTFRLSPRVFVEHPSQARWAIFDGAEPSQEPFARGWRIYRYGPNLAVAHEP